VLELPTDALDQLVAHCLRALPHEGCGLLVGDPRTGRVASVVPVPNVANSALRYEIDPGDLLVADRAATAEGLDLLGSFHSHTHTEAYPSPTDVTLAVDPSWHWIVVSLRRPEPVVRSFTIKVGVIDEEPIVLVEVTGQRNTE
jgi:[CysO sulfur-carrier protein]-S-L-cysteine hydrolase